MLTLDHSPCATIEDATMFDVPIINIYYRNILLNMLGIKAMHLATKILNFANERIGTRKMTWKAWLPWASVRSKCTGCKTCYKEKYTQAAANMVYAAKRVWKTVCRRLVREDLQHS